MKGDGALRVEKASLTCIPESMAPSSTTVSSLWYDDSRTKGGVTSAMVFSANIQRLSGRLGEGGLCAVAVGSCTEQRQPHSS